MALPNNVKSYRALQGEQVKGFDVAVEGLGVAYDAMDSGSPWGVEIAEMIIRIAEMNYKVKSDLGV